MFKPMRRKDREISKEKTYKLLKEGEFGVLGTIGSNGYPSGTPFSYALDDNNIYIHYSNMGTIAKSIKTGDKVSFTIVGKTNVIAKEFTTDYESVMVFGIAKVQEGEEKKHGLIKILEKYAGNFMPEGLEHIKEDIDDTGVLKIEIMNMTGKKR